RLAAYSFDPHGNFSFGVPDYTDFEGMKYDPEIGVFGMDVAVALQRPGYRISRRKIARRRIPKAHRISKDEGIEFVRSSFQVEVVE
ncbi:MAG TPA: 50S ribosomal protein L5, partial [Thermoplasmata archaeon]|nr:50S ribosomal protein L5 [Thermoplasmata archaeon]